jgi:glycine cleavage system H protein
MNIPEDFSYSKEHVWVKPAEDGNWLAGITDYAQDLLGDIVYVEPPAIGTALKAGIPCGLVESVKTGSDLHAPLDGVVVAINENLHNTPELINDAPYEAWIFRFKPDDSADIKALLDAKSYREITARS